MKYIQFALLSFLISHLYSCKKEPDNNCQEIQQTRITGAKNSYYVGDTISLTVNAMPTIALFIWNQGSNPNSISGNQNLFIYPCSKANEGWYYMSVSNPWCIDIFQGAVILPVAVELKEDEPFVPDKLTPQNVTCIFPFT